MSTQLSTPRKKVRRKPDPERIRKYLAGTGAELWKKPVEELTPEEIARMKRQFFSGV